MRTIHKHSTPAPGEILTYKISNSQIIHVGLDGYGNSCFWIDIETDKEHDYIDFFVVGTGWEFPNKPGFWPLHTGSWIEDTFVWHLYRWVNVRYMGFDEK